MDIGTGAFLVGAGLVGGLVDSVAGGGGAITLPAMLAAGLPPLPAVATNKVVGTSSATIASLVFARGGHIDWRLLLRVGPLSLAGGVVGALVASRVDASVLRLMILLTVVGVAGWVVFRPDPGPGHHRPEHRARAIAIAAGLAAGIGLYDGVLGPGTGIFLFAGLTGLLGYDFVTAAGTGRVLNLASNAGALVVFISLGQVRWLPALVMAAGVVVGARAGSGLAVRGGARIIRPMLGVAAVLLSLRLVAQLLGH
ncbi:MAG: TSUP family transporter [Candidatus Dormibacteria bacterium]